MAKQTDDIQKAQNAIALKVEEWAVNANNPWQDDLLQRRDIAKRLTNMVAYQKAPLTIGLHGGWGTGKTFLLKRWQKDLEKQGFKAIYFNAWEDDFCDDPLLAILAQLADHFKEEKLKELARSAAKVAIPLIRDNALGILKATTGITLKVDQGEKDKTAFLDAYLEQKATKAKLKKNLSELSSNVMIETDYPLVFIIDELDRCRPTFAIELLERVKHIFDVPNMVFVFGLNRNELCKALSSVYGDIESDVYLRRFFDFEFNLSEVDSQKFAEHLINKYQLDKVAGTIIDSRQLELYGRIFPQLWSALSLSLRDIDYGIRLVAILMKTVPAGTFIHPYLLALLIAMKFKKPELYSELIRGDVQAGRVIDYIDGELNEDLVDESLTRHVDRIEGFLYCADRPNRVIAKTGISALSELRTLRDNTPKLGFQIISHRAQNADNEQLRWIMIALEDGKNMKLDYKVFSELAALVDTCQPMLRR